LKKNGMQIGGEVLKISREYGTSGEKFNQTLI
jgi:hypothetical protein